MGKLLLLSILLGLDNLRVTVALGMAGMDADARRRLAVSFASVEALAPVAGLALGTTIATGPWWQPVAPVALAVAATLALCGALWGWPVHRWLGGRCALLVLPAALATDNLAAGIGLVGTGAVLTAALTAGMASAFWSLLGLELGARIRRPLARRPARVAMAALAAAGLLLTGVAVT
jgi:putative Mn2+ efflux pump MntP